MQHANRIIRPFMLLLIGSLLTALLMPLASWAGQQTIALAPGDQITLTCPTGMNGTAPGTQATLSCAAPTPTATPPSAPAPAITAFTGVKDGQKVTGVVAIVAQATGTNIAKVAFQLDGPKSVSFLDQAAPFTFMGDVNGKPNGWNTAQYPNGGYMLMATVTNKSGQSSSSMLHFEIANGVAQQPTAVPPAPTVVPPAPTVVPPVTPVPPVSTPVVGGANTFLETFSGTPASPQPWKPANWDVAVHSRDVGTWNALEPMQAMHGSDCAGPPATHTVTSYEDAVFICKDHMMTAIKAGGYGAIYLTPNQQVDFSNGEAVISWDMSTMRMSGRDWVDLMITPFNDNLELPLEDWLPDLTGLPRNAIHIRMDLTNGNTMFRTSVVRNYVETEVSGQNLNVGFESFLKPDPARRDKFELRLSRTHIQFGMPAYNFYWSNSALPDLGWTRGIVQFGHHSYNPEKTDGCPINQNKSMGCMANTWHWDNVSISPAVPFMMVRANQRTAGASNNQVTFPAPAPANARLRFAGIGTNVSVSFNGGATWQAAQLQAQSKRAEDHFSSYWTPIPAGTTSVQFRGTNWYGGPWQVRDLSIWAQ